MEGNFTTVVISAGVGGVAGAVFPVIKDAISFVVLDSPSEIEKLYADLKVCIAEAKSRNALQKEVTAHTASVNRLVNQGKDLFHKYRQGSSFEALSSDFVSTMLELQNEQAYLGPLDLILKARPEAAVHLKSSIAFANHMRKMLQMMRANEFSDPGVLGRKDGDASNAEVAMGRLTELQARVYSSQTQWIRTDTDEDIREDHRMAEMERTIRDLKRKRWLSIAFLISLGVGVLVMIPVLLHYGKFGAATT
jgi:hypothetical protein